MSRLDYCNAILYGLPDAQLQKLQLVQNSAARLVTGTRRREHITPVLFALHWLPIRQRIQFKLLGVRSLANASRARQFNPLNPPGVGWVPLPQTNMAAVVARARSCVVGRARSCVRGRSCVVVRGRARSCMRGRA